MTNEPFGDGGSFFLPLLRVTATQAGVVGKRCCLQAPRCGQEQAALRALWVCEAAAGRAVGLQDAGL